MVGGNQSFGAGGWQATAVEEALPVNCEIKAVEVQSKGGLVMILHGCEMPQGNDWEKKIAKLAVDRLGPADEVGVIDFMGGRGDEKKWVVELMPVGPNKARIKAAIDAMQPMDMMDFDPALRLARDGLMAPGKDFVTRHIILVSDGDPQQNDGSLLKDLKDKKITVTTVIVAGHGTDNDRKKMKKIADDTGGRAYEVKSPTELPEIFIKEVRRISQSFLFRKELTPRLVRASLGGPVDRKIVRGKDQQGNEVVPNIRGFVRTSPKPGPLVEVAIVTPPLADQNFPVLASWTFGLGKSVAWTSDAGVPEFFTAGTGVMDEGREPWSDAGKFEALWERVVEWVMRPYESGRLVMTTEMANGKIRVQVEARDNDGKLDTSLELTGFVTMPRDAKSEPIDFAQKSAGLYEATIKAEDDGTYIITAQALKKKVGPDGKETGEKEVVDSVRAGVTLPYSPEFADLQPNRDLLVQIAEITDGKVYKETELAKVIADDEIFRPSPNREKGHLPLWYWLVILTGLGVFIDVALRRVAFDPQEAKKSAQKMWLRVRGQTVPEAGQEARVAAGRPQDRGRAGRRFEAQPGVVLPAPPIAGVEPAPAGPGAGPRPPGAGGVGGPEAEPAQPTLSPEEYAERLAQAKKRARGGDQDRDKEKR
jgi:hypothetical protein